MLANMLRTGLLCLCGLLLPGLLTGALAQSEQMYKWVDEHGTTHYSALPPAGRGYEVVDMAGGRLSFVPAPEYAIETPSDPESRADQRPVAGTAARPLDPVSRANRCDELGVQLRWLVAGRADMLTGVFPEEQVRNVTTRGALIEQVAAEIDELC